MAQSTVFNGWLRYDRLDTPCPDLTAAFALGWRFTDCAQETWTERFNNVKSDLPGFSNAATEVIGSALRSLLGQLGLEQDRVLLIAALSSDQVNGGHGNVMQRIARAVSHNLGCQFNSQVLTKKRHEQLHNTSDATTRRSIMLQAQYQASRLHGIKAVFVFDDFITTGTTMGAIAAAIRHTNPEVLVYGVALGKTERLSYAPHLSNGHIPQEWDRAWLSQFGR